MNRAVFLDRDGTINVDYGYVYKYEDFKFIEGAIEGLKMLQNAGYKIIVITNQSGIARGYFTEEDFQLLNQKVNAELYLHGVTVDAVYHCPHLGEGCFCRKPKTGLFYQAAKDFNIDFSKSYALGDRMRDLSICQKEPVKGFLINSEGDKGDGIKTAVSLLEAAGKICSQNLEKNKC